MAVTYDPINTYTTTSTAASYTISSIPSTYTDLILVITGGVVSANGSFFVQCNTDTGSNYSWTSLYGNGSSAASNRSSNTTYMFLSGNAAGAGASSVTIAQFNNYANTTTNKTMLSRYGKSDADTGANVGLWRSTAAINAIKVLAINGSGLIDTGVTFTLYGIKAA